MTHEGGKGLTVLIGAVGTDIIPTQDEELQTPPQITHPRDKYPLIQRNACIRFKLEDKLMWGLIGGIDSVNQRFEIKSSDRGIMEMPFNTKFTVLDTNADLKCPNIKPGNIFHAALDSDNYPQVFKILAIDRKLENVFLHRVDRKGCSRCSDMPLDSVRKASEEGYIYDRETQIATIKGKFSAISELDFENCLYPGRITFKDTDEQIKTWEILDLNTFPAFIELINPKSNQEIASEATLRGSCEDVYNRVQIRPEQILNWELLSQTQLQ